MTNAKTSSSDPAQDLFEQLLEQQQQRQLPPVETWHPERNGSIDIRIARDGRWYHEGGLIRRQPMVALFASVLRHDEDGYVLVTPAERLHIEVEDVPFLATAMEQRGSGSQQSLLFTTNVGDHVLLSAEHPLRLEAFDGTEVPYVKVRGGLWARLDRPVYYRLVELAEPDAEGVTGVWSDGVFHLLQRS